MNDPLLGIYLSLATLLGPFLVLLWVAHIVSITRSLKKIRQESEKQTELLAQIERNTRPTSPVASASAASSPLNYIREDNKVSFGTVVLVGLVVLAVGFFIVMLTRVT